MSFPAAAAARVRVLTNRLLSSIGFRDDAFLLLVAAAVGVVTAIAAVGFHELIVWIAENLYRRIDPELLYRPMVWLLIAWPMLGGLVVGILSNHVFRAREGQSVIDVMESVMRSSGFIRPLTAIEKIITSGVTIGSGGSCGAEGPILQIGAAIASGIGQFFRLSRSHMPLIIGCGTAAGVSAIFNSPMGGLLFTLEVILLDFSIRAITPVIIASVIANVTTQAAFRVLHQTWPLRHPHPALAIFTIPRTELVVTWPQMLNFILLGVACAIVAVTLTRLMYRAEHTFGRLRRTPPAIRPAIGGALLGLLGVAYVVIFGWLALGQRKPIPFDQYPMPAFFGDGYGFTQQLFTADFYSQFDAKYLMSLLAFLIVAKIVGTCFTIGSGGSGGIIAPSLFLGAVTGGLLGMLLARTPLFAEVQPAVYALVGMAAVLAAVVHAPLASILILLDLTGNYQLALPAMLATIVATGVARRIYPDSIYTMILRQRGVRVGGRGDYMLLRRLSVEQVKLDPASLVKTSDPFQLVIDRAASMGVTNFPVIDGQGYYVGMIVDREFNLALLDREAVPLLLVEELMRRDIPLVRNTDDLASVLEIFARFEIDHLPVSIEQAPGKVIGLISRGGLMRAYQTRLAE
jgi:CIC family chloride channel protein